VYSNIYNLVIGKLFPSSTLGLYTRGSQFAHFAGSNISSILQRVAFPVLSEIQDDNTRLISAYKKYIKVATWGAFPLILGVCGVAKPMIQVLLTEKWVPCVPYLQILCFAVLWDCVTLVNLNLLYVKGRSDWVLRLEIVKKSIAFLILIVSMVFDMYIICLGQAIYAFLAFFLNTFYTNKMFNYGFISQMKDLLPQLLLSLIMMAMCIIVSNFIYIPFIALFVSVMTGVFVYWMGSELLGLYGYTEFCSIIKQRLHK
jgi:O-antigen/teichoic acid export membrane protein